MARLTYNGITLNYTTTRQFIQEAVYDPSGVDYLYTRVFIEIESVWNPLVFPIGLPLDPSNPLSKQVPESMKSVRGKFPAVAMAGTKYPGTKDGLRQALLQPRQRLSYSDDEGNILLDVGEKSTDEKRGPFPRFCNIEKLPGSTTWNISFGIETFITECPNPQNRNGVLSNRWRETMRIDRQMFQTRTHQGRIIISGALTSASDRQDPITADHFRGWAFPPIPVGFDRDSIEITSTESGLELDYVVTDKQRYRVTDQAGPATEIKADYTERTGSNGATVDAEIRVAIKGKPDSDPTDLLILATQIVMSRIGIDIDPSGKGPRPNGKPGIFGALSSCQITEDLMNPFLSMNVSVKKAFVDGDISLGGKDKPPVPFGIDKSRIGLPRLPGTSNILTKEPNRAGLSSGSFGIPGKPGIELLAQVLANPCGGIPGDSRRQKTTVSVQPTEALLGFGSDQEEPPLYPGTPTRAGREAPSTLTGRSFIGTVVNILTEMLVSLTVQFVNSLDTQTTQYSKADFQHIYTDYSIDTSYKTDSHYVQLPRASNVPAPARIIRLAAPTSTRLVKWTAERIGALPELPNPVPKPNSKTGLVNEILGDWEVIPAAPVPAPNAVDRVYRISGFYSYLLVNAITPQQSLELGAMPNLRAYAKENLMQMVYTDTILDPLGSPPSTA